MPQDNTKKQLTVAVFCHPRLEILKKNLLALKEQSLSLGLWDPVFWFREPNPLAVNLILDHFAKARVMASAPLKPFYESRNQALHCFETPYLYCIDEDVILENTEHLSRLLALHKSFPQAAVLGGAYLNHRDCSFWGLCYNWIVRLWMKNHAGFVPAGNLSIKTHQKFKARFYSPARDGFGGEEISFLKSLQKEGFKPLYQASLDAPHLCRHNMKTFFKRALRHSFAGNMKTAPSSVRLFLKEPGPFFVKLSALCYLALARVGALATRRFLKAP